MISEKIILRIKPLFEFDFLENGFQVTDESKDNTTRFYEYKIIKDLKHKLKSINWFATVSNYFWLLIGFSNKTDIQVDGYQIRFKYGKEKIIILTENCEYKTVIQVSEKIKSNISHLNTQYYK